MGGDWAETLGGIYVWWQGGNLWEAEMKAKPEREVEMVGKALAPPVWKPLRHIIMCCVPVPPTACFVLRRHLQFLFQRMISCLIVVLYEHYTESSSEAPKIRRTWTCQSKSRGVHEDDQRTGAPLLWGKVERIVVIQHGEDLTAPSSN